MLKKSHFLPSSLLSQCWHSSLRRGLHWKHIPKLLAFKGGIRAARLQPKFDVLSCMVWYNTASPHYIQSALQWWCSGVSAVASACSELTFMFHRPAASGWEGCRHGGSLMMIPGLSVRLWFASCWEHSILLIYGLILSSLLFALIWTHCLARSASLGLFTNDDLGLTDWSQRWTNSDLWQLVHKRATTTVLTKQHWLTPGSEKYTPLLMENMLYDPLCMHERWKVLC